MSSRDSEHEQRLRLEGDVELLEAAHGRLRVVLDALEAKRWGERLRESADEAHALVHDEGRVRTVSERALRRMKAEDWERGETTRLVESVASSLKRLDGVLRQRGLESLAAGLKRFVGVPRRVPADQREAAAREVLPAGGALVHRLQQLERDLVVMMGRPRQPKELPCTYAEWMELQPVWRDGERALSEAWVRVMRIDLTRGVQRWLQERSAVAPRNTSASSRAGFDSSDGPRALTGAAYWHRWTVAKRATALQDHFAPVAVGASEVEPCFRFLLARHADAEVTLQGVDAGSRRALLVLAHEVLGGAPGRVVLPDGTRRVRELALEADGLDAGDDDWRRMRDVLRAVMMRTRYPKVPPIQRTVDMQARALEKRLVDFFPE